MANWLRGLLRRIMRPVDQRFAHVDRRTVDSVETIIRHTDQRFGEISSLSDERLQRTLGAIAGLQREIEAMRADIDVAHRTMIESTAYVGRAFRRLADERGHPDGSLHLDLAELRELLERLATQVDPLVANLDTKLPAGAIEHPAPADHAAPVPDSNDEPSSGPHSGREGSPIVAYAVRALARTAPGATILDVGGGESTLPLSLAGLGYEVTVVDSQPCLPFHPGLHVVTTPLEEWGADSGSYDAALAISSLGRIRVGGNGRRRDPGPADVAAIARIRQLLRAGGRLILTVPVGTGGHDEGDQTYNKASLEDLLTDWMIEDWTLVEQVEPGSWSLASTAAFDDDRPRLAMVTAIRP